MSALDPQHQKLLDDSGISPDVALARGYRSAYAIDELAGEGFTEPQRILPALLLPVWTVAGTVAFCQSRPDEPRKSKGRVIKYETPTGQRMVLDVPPGAREDLDDPTIPLLITEGIRKADAAVSAGYCCIDVLGVDCWRGTNDKGGKAALADWESIALNGRMVYLAFDSDMMVKPGVWKALERFKKFLEFKGAIVYVVRLPGSQSGAKVGLDDFLVGGSDLDALMEEARDAEDFVPIGKLTETLDDIGDAIRFAQRNRGEVAWSAHLDAWLVWKSELRGSGLGGRWVQDIGEIDIMNRVKLMVTTWYAEAAALIDEDRGKLVKHAMECGSYHRLQSILKSARNVLAVDITTFDQDDYLLNCQNGVLDLRTFTRRSAAPTDRCRWQAEVEYVAGATDKVFERYLTENIPNEQTRDFYQEIAGYMLIGDRSAEFMAHAHGPKRSGKTTFAEISRLSLGSYAHPVPPEFFMTSDRPLGAEANRPLLAALVNKRLITSPEGSKEHTFDVAFVKRLTGGDPVNACAKYRDPFDYVPKFFILIYGNHQPKADFEEDAMRSRLLELPFPKGRNPDEVDATVKTYLLTEPSARRAWLAWAVEGLRRLMVEKKSLKPTPPPEVTAATAAYWEAQNRLGPFLKMLVLDPAGFIPSLDLSTAFNTWNREDDVKASLDEVTAWLKANGCRSRTKTLPGGTRTRAWFGVRWASVEPEPDPDQGKDGAPAPEEEGLGNAATRGNATFGKVSTREPFVNTSRQVPLPAVAALPNSVESFDDPFGEA